MSKLAISSKSTLRHFPKLTPSLDTEAHLLTTVDRFALFLCYTIFHRQKFLKFLPKRVNISQVTAQTVTILPKPKESFLYTPKS